VININKNTDAEIFTWLNSLDVPYGAEVKKAIKEYIKKHSSAAAEKISDEPPWFDGEDDELPL